MIRDYYDSPELQAEDISRPMVMKADEEENTENKYSKYRFDLGGGFGYRIARTPDDISQAEKEYLDNLRGGLNLEVSFTYFIRESIGIGISYNRFSTSEKVDNVFITFDSSQPPELSPLEEKFRINYIGPDVNYRGEFLNEKFKVLLGIGFGYMNYYVKSEVDQGIFTTRGETIGNELKARLDYMLNKNLAFGLNLSYLTGVLSKVEVSNGVEVEEVEFPENQKEGLHRVNISAALKYYL